MGQGLHSLLLERAWAASARAGLETAALEEQRSTLERLVVGTDFTGLALAQNLQLVWAQQPDLRQVQVPKQARLSKPIGLRKASPRLTCSSTNGKADAFPLNPIFN